MDPPPGTPEVSKDAPAFTEQAMWGFVSQIDPKLQNIQKGIRKQGFLTGFFQFWQVFEVSAFLGQS